MRGKYATGRIGEMTLRGLIRGISKQLNTAGISVKDSLRLLDHMKALQADLKAVTLERLQRQKRQNFLSQSE